MKLHETQRSAILPSSLQRVEFQNFTPACAITIVSYIKVKISDFQTRFHNELRLLAVPSESRRQRADFFVHRAEADSLPS